MTCNVLKQSNLMWTFIALNLHQAQLNNLNPRSAGHVFIRPLVLPTEAQAEYRRLLSVKF